MSKLPDEQQSNSDNQKKLQSIENLTKALLTKNNFSNATETAALKAASGGFEEFTQKEFETRKSHPELLPEIYLQNPENIKQYAFEISSNRNISTLFNDFNTQDKSKKTLENAGNITYDNMELDPSHIIKVSINDDNQLNCKVGDSTVIVTKEMVSEELYNKMQKEGEKLPKTKLNVYEANQADKITISVGDNGELKYKIGNSSDTVSKKIVSEELYSKMQSNQELAPEEKQQLYAGIQASKIEGRLAPEEKQQLYAGIQASKITISNNSNELKYQMGNSSGTVTKEMVSEELYNKMQNKQELTPKEKQQLYAGIQASKITIFVDKTGGLQYKIGDYLSPITDKMIPQDLSDKIKKDPLSISPDEKQQLYDAIKNNVNEKLPEQKQKYEDAKNALKNIKPSIENDITTLKPNLAPDDLSTATKEYLDLNNKDNSVLKGIIKDSLQELKPEERKKFFDDQKKQHPKAKKFLDNLKKEVEGKKSITHRLGSFFKKNTRDSIDEDKSKSSTESKSPDSLGSLTPRSTPSSSSRPSLSKVRGLN